MNPIVVLGARIIDGRPSRMLASRLTSALSIYNAAPRPIVVSGRGEAEVMALWLAERGVPLEHIVVEPHATSTNENLERARALFPDAARLTVVTSNFHVARTAVWAWHLGIPVDLVGAPMPPGYPKSKIKNYSRELIAVPHSLARVLWRRLVAQVRG
ncbi:YdcF family protein [Corynebacterium sp. Q4381]|uniref:YdcF family protein n=1 Tax=Corynebacterium sp. Marseille-Q4381 TaxID=3121597 RepID=UPI002FE5F312